ncbi:hypothetical protein ACFQV4_35880 [Streptomyces thermocarboxydus]
MSAAKGALDGLPDDTSGMSDEEKEKHDKSAKDKRRAYETADGELEAVRSRARTLHSEYVTAADTTARALKDAADDAPPEPGWFDDLVDGLTEFLSDAWDTITDPDFWKLVGDLLADIAMVIGVVCLVAMLLGTGVGALGLIGFLVGLGALAAHGAAMAGGAEGVTWETLAWDALGVVAGGVGLAGAKLAQEDGCWCSPAGRCGRQRASWRHSARSGPAAGATSRRSPAAWPTRCAVSPWRAAAGCMSPPGRHWTSPAPSPGSASPLLQRQRQPLDGRRLERLGHPRRRPDRRLRRLRAAGRRARHPGAGPPGHPVRPGRHAHLGRRQLQQASGPVGPRDRRMTRSPVEAADGRQVPYAFRCTVPDEFVRLPDPGAVDGWYESLVRLVPDADETHLAAVAQQLRAALPGLSRGGEETVDMTALCLGTEDVGGEERLSMGLLAVTVRPSGHRDRLLTAEGVYRAKERRFFSGESDLRELDFPWARGAGPPGHGAGGQAALRPGVMSTSLRMVTLPSRLIAEAGLGDLAAGEDVRPQLPMATLQLVVPAPRDYCVYVTISTPSVFLLDSYSARLARIGRTFSFDGPDEPGQATG